ncbi:DUF3293 domain-containing protein [Rhodobacteraceae bacterium B1Z28]|uniref:DUF3293 domain-containing protein n=1 Tax=Ruegeria haliotis TaxID=2747601 RepID=A0ABX2PVL4_9RHOB|nr:DUF3293 domain-containing protein [Ruegeria haliotis]NVO58227.1 DUF3293 domain-containing protein [Ruegeria haliotis]
MAEPDHWAGYRTATYEVFASEGTFLLELGKPNPALEALLDLHNADHAAFITASNPGARKLTDEENRIRAAELHRECTMRRYHLLPGRGGAPDWGWEESLLVLGITEADALMLGQQFGQDAVLVTDNRRHIQLRDCAKPNSFKQGYPK